MTQIGKEINLLARYPKTNRNLTERLQRKSEHVRTIAKQFGFEYFDGNREYGYGGFNYDPRFWTDVVQDFVEHYKLTSESEVLDVGCAKGFFLYDLQKAVPGIRITGVDISTYAIEHSLEEVKPHLLTGDSRSLPFPDKAFDLVISINTIHNLDREGCGESLREIERVSRKDSFIMVDAYRNDEEKERMYAWNLTALTIMSDKEWKDFFKEVGYSGDFFWFIP